MAGKGRQMIRYKCSQCSAKLESPVSLAGELDKCPMCGYECSVPNPRNPKRRAFMILGGAAGVLTGAVLAVAITLALTSGAGPSPSPSNDTPGLKTTAQPVAQSPAAQQEPSREKPTPPSPAQAQSPKRPEPAPLTPEQLFEKASPAVVYIVVRDKDFKPLGLGSGFFVDANGLVATNYHVIKGAEFATARLSNGSTVFVDGVVATDPNGDLALLKLSGSGFPCLKRAEGALPKVGAAVFAIGNPQGLENTFSSGMVSGHREIKEGLKVIQVTTPISPGSSGGPLLNAGGEVVGVTTAYLATGQNLNFAVPVSGVLALIRKQGKVQTLASASGRRLDSAETDELDKAWAAMEKKDWSTAAKILTDLRERQKDNPFVWFALGRMHYELGNQEFAIQHYETAIVLKPGYAEAYCGMGYAYRKLKLYPQAVEAYKKAIAINPGDAWSYCSMGLAYYSDLKRYPEAIEACRKAIAIDPNFAGVYVLMGHAFRDLKRYPEAIDAYKKAIAAYKKAIAIKPDNAEAYIQMGVAYRELKHYPEAIEAYKKAIAFKPEFADAYRLMGVVYDDLKRYPESIEAYKKAIAIEPDDAMAYSFMGNAYDELKRYAEAIEAYKKAVAIKPDYAEAYVRLGLVYLILNRYPEAIEACKKAIPIEPDNAIAYWSMGNANEQLKRYPEAVAAYEQFLRLKPTGDLADSVRKDLPELRRLAGK